MANAKRFRIRDTQYDLVSTLTTSPTPITSTTADTPANWAELGDGFYWFNTAGQLNGQPSRYGILYNIVYSDSVTQIWIRPPEGLLYVRGGNQNGWSANGWVPYLPTTGGTMTGDLVLSNATWRIQRPNADISASSISANQYAAFGATDKNDKYIGYIQPVNYTNGMTAIQIAARKYIDNANVDNSLNLRVDASGVKTVTVSDKNAWLDGIGAAPASHTHSYLPLSGGTVTGNIITKGNDKCFILKNSDDTTTGAIIGTSSRVYLRSYNTSTGYRIDAYLPIPEAGQTSNQSRYIPTMNTGTSALTSGTSVLPSNCIYLQYE